MDGPETGVHWIVKAFDGGEHGSAHRPTRLSPPVRPSGRRGIESWAWFGSVRSALLSRPRAAPFLASHGQGGASDEGPTRHATGRRGNAGVDMMRGARSRRADAHVLHRGAPNAPQNAAKNGASMLNCGVSAPFRLDKEETVKTCQTSICV